ncbi:TPA: hypothetical protein ACH3X1_014672 [Trebouxia sp. C0004]
MPPTYPIITVKWVGLESLSSEELLQRFTDKQRKRICSKRVLGLDACGNPLKSLEGLEAYSQLVSLSMARCQLTSLGCTLQVLGLANNHLTSLDGLEGSLSLQSLRVEGNNIKQDLDIRTLAVLPNLRHLGLAGNPVMADMDFSQQRAFLVDLMPGLLTLDNQAVSSSVSAHLYSVRESKLGRTHPHQFNEQLLFGSSDETETPVVKVEAAPTSAVHLAAKQHQLQQQHALLQSAPSTQLHLSQQLPEQLWQQLQQQQAQQLSVQRPTSAPQMKGPHIAFGHKADWDFSTGSKRVDGRLDGQAKGKSARLNGQNLALLENSDWAHLRNEVPVNRHVTVEHACQLAHHGSASLPFGNTSEKQNTPLKSRPDSAALNFSSSPSPKAPGTLIGKAGMQVLDGTSSSPQPPKTLSFGTQLPVGSAASSPRSLSPNSYLARSGMSKTLPNSGAGIGSPKSTQPRSSSPLSRPGKPQTLANPSSGQPCSSSPLSRPATAGHLLEQSQGQKAPPGRAARSRGRTSSSAWRAAQEEMQKLDPAKPSFMQTLRTRSLSPEYWHAKSKGTAVAWPTWQQYERHVTPDRALARPACIRRVFQGIARTTPGIHDQQGRAFCSELAEAGPSGIDHVPNQAPTVSSKPVNKKSSAKRLQSSVQSPGTSSAVKAWSPAGKAPSTARAAPGKLLSPAAKGQSLGLQPFSPSASASLAGHTQLNGSSGARASPAQPQPIRAGQQAIAALLAKQAAWEVTRTSSLPPVLSEITALLRCNSKSFLTPPARTATELAVAADPQLRQAAWESATAVVVDGSERQQVPSLEAAAVAATASQADAAQELPDGAKQGIAASSTAEDAVSSQMQAPVPVPKPSLSSRSLKSELRVSFAKQIQIDIEAEGQHAQRGSKTPGGNYFLGAGYFQEADNVMAAEQHAASERQESGIEDAEKRLEAEEQGEEADDETVAENLYDAGGPGEPSNDNNASAAEAEQSSSSVPRADDAHGLDAFLHTVTTADDVLNDLLGELCCSSSLTPAELSLKSSSAVPDQAQAGSPCTVLPAEASVSKAVRASSTQAAAAALRSSSSSPASAAEDCSSSAKPGQRSPSPSRASTDVVSDALLEDLHTAELARQSSSSVLLHSLNSLPEMHRQSSPSPVAGSSASAMLSIHSSSSSPAAAIHEYSQHIHPSSSSPEPGAARQGSFRQQSSSSAAQPAVDAEACCEGGARHLLLQHAESETGEEWVLEKDEEGWGLKAAANPFHTLRSVAVTGLASSSPAMLGQASSSAGHGRADSADASLEALLAELSSASATAAAALAPFTSSSAAAAAAPRAPLSRSASSQLVQTVRVAQRGAAQHGAAQHDEAQHGTARHDTTQHSTAQHDAAQHGTEQQDIASPLSRQCSTSTAFPPKAVTADLTAHNVRQFESSHMTFASAVPSPASLSPQSSSPLLAAASSATSLAPRSSTPLEGSHLGSQFVAILQGELQQHQEAFNDDLAFIQEVQTRQTLAAGMHPNQELLSLHKRFNNWKFDFKVRMRDIEKTMRQMERDEYRHARGLTSPTGRTDSGRTTPMGRGTLPGITPSASGFTTPSGRVTPPGVTSEVAAFGRVTPPSTSVSGRTTPTGKVTPPGTSPSGRATPTDRSANPTANAGNPQGFATADAAVIASTIDRGVSGLTSPAESATPSGVSFTADDHAGLSSAFLHESSSAPDASTNTLVSGVANETADVFGQQQAYSSGLSMNGSATAVGLEHAIIDISSGSLATAVPGQLVSARSSVKEAIAMYEGSHPVSTRLSNSQYTAAQQSSSPSEGAYSKLTSSQSSVAYQTKSLSEGVYGKLYSSKSSVSQIATSPSWDQGEEEELISSSIPAAGSRHIAGSGFSTASGGGGRGADATSSSEISRFGGGIGRGGMNKYAVEVKPADWDAANQEAELDPSSER